MDLYPDCKCENTIKVFKYSRTHKYILMHTFLGSYKKMCFSKMTERTQEKGRHSIQVKDTKQSEVKSSAEFGTSGPDDRAPVQNRAGGMGLQKRGLGLGGDDGLFGMFEHLKKGS